MNWAIQEVRETRFLINRYDNWIYAEIAPYLGQRVLEVGCGLGNFIHHLRDRELVVGIDSDWGSIDHLRRKYGENRNPQFHAVDICDQEVLDLEPLGFDTVVSLNVFEHIENDLLALRNVRRLLRPNGCLILIVPAHSWLYGTMDMAIGHYRRYDKASLAKNLTETGFVPMNQRYLNTLGAVGWFANGRMLRRRVPPHGQLRLFNMLVPVLRSIEMRFSPPMGLSLLSVGK